MKNWELDPSQTGIVQKVVSRNDAGEIELRCIAMVYVGYRKHIKPCETVIDRKEHAALIAAAPDLLEACKARENVLWGEIEAITSCKPGEPSQQLSPDEQEKYLKLNAEWTKVNKAIAKAESV